MFIERVKFAYHDSEGPDVASVVYDLSCKKLGRSIYLCSGRGFEGSEGICIRQTEVNDLDVLAVMGDEDVLRLEVSVDDLLAVHVVKCVTDFADDLLGKLSGYSLCGDEFFKGTGVNPLHHNAAADGRMIYLSEILTEAGVGE